MSRYVIQFYKKDYMRFISHLDMIRLFRRSLSRIGVKLKYSQGFNPHPKMSFPHPLSLGYESSCEYLEFETEKPALLMDLVKALSEIMPEGIGITAAKELPPSKISLGSLLEYADYTVKMPLAGCTADEAQKKLQDYLAQDEILMEKQKKKGRGKIMVFVDIKPLIVNLVSAFDSGTEGGSEAKNDAEPADLDLSIRIAAGTARNLNPEAMIKNFCEFAGISFEKESLQIRRTALLWKDGDDTYCPLMDANVMK